MGEAVEGEIDLITVESSDDPWYRQLVEKLQQEPENYPNLKLGGTRSLKLVKFQRDWNWVRIIPHELRDSVLKECHDSPVSGHLGIKKTYYRVKELYFWPDMKSSCTSDVNSCKICLMHKSD